MNTKKKLEAFKVVLLCAEYLQQNDYDRNPEHFLLTLKKLRTHSLNNVDRSKRRDYLIPSAKFYPELEPYINSYWEKIADCLKEV